MSSEQIAPHVRLILGAWGTRLGAHIVEGIIKGDGPRNTGDAMVIVLGYHGISFPSDFQPPLRNASSPRRWPLSQTWTLAASQPAPGLAYTGVTNLVLRQRHFFLFGQRRWE